jgi:hypothetical protein
MMLISRLAGLLPLVALLATLVPAATAQEDAVRERRNRGLMLTSRQLRPDFLRRDMRYFSEQLGLDAAQKGIVESLLRDYETAFGAAAERMRERFRAVELPGGDSDETAAEREALRQRLLELARSAREERQRDAPRADVLARLEREIADTRQDMTRLRLSLPEGNELQQLQRQIDGMRAVLNERQLEQWPAFERNLRRQKTLPEGRLSGEMVDPVILLRELRIEADASAALRDAVERYAVAADGALVARNDFLADARLRTMVAMLGRDLDTAIEIATRETRLREAVRDTNDRGVAWIAAALDGEQAVAVRALWRQRAFPSVYQPTPTERAFRVAAALEDLDAEQEVIVIALRDMHREELASRNAALEAAIRARETSELQRRIRRWQGQRLDPEDDPVRQALEGRAELDERFRAQLEVILMPQQVARLPEPPQTARPRTARENPVLREYDLDGDGVLSDEERAAARRAFRPRFRRDDR